MTSANASATYSASDPVRELMGTYGSPLWLADLDRFRANLHDFTAAWRAAWPRVQIAYSYKTNRLLAFLHAAEVAGVGAEVVCEVEYQLAAGVVEVDPVRIVVDGPAKPNSLLARAGAGGALVLADSAAELSRAAALGVRRIGLRVATDSFTGARTRFGIPAAEVLAAARAAAALGLNLEALSTHLVSTDFDPRTGGVVVSWPRPASEHHRAALRLAELARELTAAGHPVATIDLGGGFPPPASAAGHAAAVARGLRAGGFTGTLLLEPGRAVVTNAVRLAFTVIAVKTLADGGRCLVCDAGTNLLPGALSNPPWIEALEAGGPRSDAVVTGPLCLNVDVLHSRSRLPKLAAGAVLLAHAVGAYQQSAATQFGEPSPAVVAGEGGTWRLHTPGAMVGDAGGARGPVALAASVRHAQRGER